MTPENAVARYPQFLKMGEDGVLEMYFDNAMMENFRKCQGAFVERYLNRIVPNGRSWALDFGSYFHTCMEYFYQAQRENWEGNWAYVGFGSIHQENDTKIIKLIKQDYANFVQLCLDLWKEYKMDEFAEYKQSKTFGGQDGAILLFSQYFKTHFRLERLRFVGWELSFGKKKEVPILDSAIYYDGVLHPFRGYYCGRIDLIVDDTEIIGPLDHKTTAKFDGSENSDYKPNDGPCGYVYSLQHILGEKFKSEGRTCNSILINHIELNPPARQDMRYRFKRSKKSYSPAELQEWLGRQQATFRHLYEVIVLEQPVIWNTQACAYWIFGQNCAYKPIHEVAPVVRDGVRKQFYQIGKPWNML